MDIVPELTETKLDVSPQPMNVTLVRNTEHPPIVESLSSFLTFHKVCRSALCAGLRATQRMVRPWECLCPTARGCLPLAGHCCAVIQISVTLSQAQGEGAKTMCLWPALSCPILVCLC